MKVSVFLIIFLVIAQTAYAKKYKDQGLYGSIGFAYLYNDYSDAKNTNSQGNFIQEYKLGYRGNIYTPRLLDYSISGLVRYENIDATISGEESRTKVQSTDYKLDFNFFKSTIVPFKIYANKSDRPTSVVYLNTVNRYLSQQEAIGFSGAINLDLFNINYSADNSKTTYENILSNEERDTKTYRASVRKREKNYNIQLDYINIEDIVDREYVNGTKTHSDNVDDNVNFQYRWDINEDLLFTANSYYKKKLFKAYGMFSTETLNAHAELRWDPKTKHTVAISMDGFTIEDKYNLTESINIRQNYAYEITKNLKIFQKADYGLIGTNLNTIQTTNLGTGISYSKRLNKDTRLSLSVNGDFRTNTSDSNSSLDTQRYYYYTRAGLYTDMNSIKSKLNISVGYNGSTSTSGEYDNRYNSSLSLGTVLSKNLRNNFRATYFKESSKLKYLSTLNDREVNNINVEDNINHNLRVGINGSLSTALGITYSYVENGEIVIEHLTPKIDMNFRYKIGARIVFTSKLHLNQDMIYDITTYSANNRLAYNSRYTKISFGYNYTNIIAGKNSEIASRESHNIEARFERKF